jgi:hypothetical protein
VRKTIKPEEMKTSELMEYAIVALAQLGGSSKKEPIVERVGEILKDHLKPADWERMYKKTSDGRQDYASSGSTDETWPVWAGKTSISLLHAKGHGWITRSKGVCTLTPEGIKHVAMHAENWLKTK